MIFSLKLVYRSRLGCEVWAVLNFNTMLENLRTKFKLYMMKRKALRLHEITGKQYFIVPVDNWKRAKFCIVNNESHKAYNQTAKKIGKPQITYAQLCAMAVFKTPVSILRTK